jgi:hypothetical protein
MLRGTRLNPRLHTCPREHLKGPGKIRGLQCSGFSSYSPALLHLPWSWTLDRHGKFAHALKVLPILLRCNLQCPLKTLGIE